MHIDYRIARLSDAPAIAELISVSARALGASHYTNEQIESALGPVFGVDTQLLKDGTYFVATTEEKIVGCGGWSKRRALYGGDKGRVDDDSLRDPNSEPAMIRAFFVDPPFARKGIGRQLMRLSEAAARAAAFGDIEIIATLPGEALYHSCGYSAVERFNVPLANGLALPVVRMRRLPG